MPEHIQYQDDDLFNPETHHEHSDVPVRPLVWALIIFVVFGIVTHIVLAFMYKGMVKAERNRAEAPATAVARPADADIPKNQPLLQPFPLAKTLPQNNTPVVDLIEMRKREDRVLKNYGWVDRQKGVVHIPIDDAKGRLVAQLSLGASRPSGAPVVPPNEEALGASRASGAPLVPPPAEAGQSPATHPTPDAPQTTTTGSTHP